MNCSGMSIAMKSSPLSRWEGLPNVVLESLALGTPVVASHESRVEDIAAATAPGSLTIASVGQEFVAAIMQHEPSPTSSPRAGLLPALYRSEAIAARFNALLARVAGA